MNAEPEIVLVVPCYNEAQRLDPQSFIAMVDEDSSLSLLFVDDGSTDGTAEIHARMAMQRPDRIRAISLSENRGKAEAVRQGLLQSLAGPADIVGYIDADLATPRTEVARLCRELRRTDACDVLLGSRVRLLGRAIDRDPLRHYLGRSFATAASLVLQLPVYDTQCGAKLFRRSPALAHALGRPFLSRWVFDVELLGRLLMGASGVPGISPERIREEPLQRWVDCKGSKLGAAHMVRALADLGRIQIDLAKRRWLG
jgi:glycosyltransferase involved in cell wall biosynthesis